MKKFVIVTELNEFARDCKMAFAVKYQYVEDYKKATLYSSFDEALGNVCPENEEFVLSTDILSKLFPTVDSNFRKKDDVLANKKYVITNEDNLLYRKKYKTYDSYRDARLEVFHNFTEKDIIISKDIILELIEKDEKDKKHDETLLKKITELEQHLKNIAIPHVQKAQTKEETLRYRESLQYAINLKSGK